MLGWGYCELKLNRHIKHRGVPCARHEPGQWSPQQAVFTSRLEQSDLESHSDWCDIVMVSIDTRYLGTVDTSWSLASSPGQCLALDNCVLTQFAENSCDDISISQYLNISISQYLNISISQSHIPHYCGYSSDQTAPATPVPALVQQARVGAS